MEMDTGNDIRKYPTLTLIAILAISMATIAGIAGGLLGGEFSGSEQQPELSVEFDNTPEGDLTVTHVGGDDVEIQKVELTYQTFGEQDTVVMRLDETTTEEHGIDRQFDGNFAEGDSFSVPTDDMSIVWHAEESDTTVFIDQYP